MAAYTTIDDPTQYFNTVLRSGLYGGSDTAFTVGFQPDWIWDKRRSDTSVHALFDSVRGFGASGKVLYSNTNGAEATNALIDSVSSTGFTIKASADNTGTLVDWCWKASGSTASNTDGSTTSTVSANTTAGFSIVSYTGAGATTYGHGLGATPNVIIIKKRTSDSGNNNWFVYHDKVITAGGSNKSFLTLNETGALASNGSATTFTSVSSTTFGVGTDDIISESSHTFIAYCFAEIKGYSKFGSYTGNGNADGTFVYTGFKPAFVLLKNADEVEQWWIFDNKRNAYDGNFRYYSLNPNATSAEGTTSGDNNHIDFLSNGFKLRTTAQQLNGASDNFIYMAFAESPFTNSNGTPNNAE